MTMPIQVPLPLDSAPPAPMWVMQVALPVPVATLFDYLSPGPVAPGSRVEAPS